MYKRLLLITLLIFFQTLLIAQQRGDDLFSNGRDAFSSKSYDTAINLFNDFLELYPDDPRADGVNYMRSVSFFYQKRYIDSINSFKDFDLKYDDSPYNSRVSYWLGLCSYALKNYSDAAQYFRIQTGYKSESFFVSRSYLYLGESYEKSNMPDEAEEAYRSGIISGGEEKIISQSRLKLGMLYFSQENYFDAKEQFLEVLNTSIDSTTISDSQFYIGECQYHLGDLRDAASKLQYYLFMSTNSKFREAAIFRLGAIYQTLNMTDEAIKYLTLLISDYPDGSYYLDGLRVLGSTYRSVKDLDKAGDIFKEIINLTDDEIEKQNYYFELAQTKIDKGLPLEAITLLKESSNGPDKSLEEMSLYYLGQLLLDNDMEDDGAVYLFELINRFPEGEAIDDASLTLSEYLIRTGDTHKLTLFVGSQLNRKGKYQDRFLYLKGELDEAEGNFEEASISYDKIINEFPDSEYVGNAIHKKAMVLIKDGREEEALPVLDMAIREAEKESDIINILVDKAIILFNLGEIEQAEYVFRTLLEKSDDFPRKNEILFKQGELTFFRHDYGSAAEYFRKAAELSIGDVSINALFNMGKSYFFDLNYKTSERIYTGLSEKLSSTSDRKTEAMKMTALSIFLQQDWNRTLQNTDLLVTSLGVYPSEIRIIKLLTQLALGRNDSFRRELDSLNTNQSENKLLVDAFNQLEKVDFNSVLLIFRSFLAVYPQESSEQLIAFLLTDLMYITPDKEWIKETFDLILPHFTDEIQIIGLKQAYEMNKLQ